MRASWHSNSPVDLTPKAGPKVVSRVDATDKPPQPKVVAAEAAAQQTAAADAAKTAQEEEQASRRQVIDKLPELRRPEGLVPATNMANYNLVPLRSGKAAEGYWDETTSKEKVMEKESFNWKIIQKEVDAHSAGMGSRALLPLGRSSLLATRSGGHKNQSNGVLKLRMPEDSAQMVAAALYASYSMVQTAGLKYTHQTVVTNAAYPGAVIEAVREQRGANAISTFDRSMPEMYVYKLVAQTPEQAAKLETEGVKLGELGTYQFVPIEQRASIETVYMIGTTGKGSAEDILLPAFSSAINVSKDLVSVSDCMEVDKSVAVVIAVKYPYTRLTYDMVDKVLSIEKFKLHNPNNPGSKPLEICVAPTILELQAITGLPLVRARKAVSDEPAKAALDFRVEPPAAAAKGALAPPHERRKRTRCRGAGSRVRGGS